MPLPSLEEVKDRKLVQWGIAYLAGAWALLQVADLIGDHFGWPGLWMRGLIVVLAVGFFGALVLAWYHGEQGRQRVRGVELGILTVLLGLAGLGVMLLGPGGADEPADGAALSAALAPEADQTTLAVLPFEAIGADSSGAAFADGLTEEILATLARSPSLRVAARTSASAVAGASADSVGRALGVAHYVEGSVRRVPGAGGGGVRVTARLVSTATGLQEWSQTYDRDGVDALALQDEIARAVAAQLQVQIGSARPRGTEDAEAYALALEGWRTWKQGGDLAVVVPAALALFERAVARDSTYAHAWAGLAAARRRMAALGLAADPEAAWAAARAAGERAVALDPAEGEGHVALGFIAEQHDGDADAARGHYERAVAANPSDAFALANLAWSYTLLGDEAAAVRTAARAAALDPLSSATLAAASTVHSYAGRHDRAVALARDAVALAPGGADALYTLANVLAIAGQTDEAVRVADRLVALYPDVETHYWVAAYAHARAGDRAGAERALSRITEFRHYVQAAVEAALGRPDSAFVALDRSVAAEEEALVEVAVDAWFAPLRADPRWAPLVARVRGPEAGG